MKNFHIALAVIAALTLGAVGTADARDRGTRHGAQKQKHAAMQHRASPRGFQRRVDRRQLRQHARVRQGAVSGRLNRRQVARLHGNQRRIRAMERHFGADGRYDRRERRILNHALDRSSKRIWRMKGKHYRRHGRHGHHGAHGPKYRVKPGYRGHGHFRGHHSRRHHSRRHSRHVEYVYPVYEVAPAHSLGLDIETKDFRFSVNKSG